MQERGHIPGGLSDLARRFGQGYEFSVQLLVLDLQRLGDLEVHGESSLRGSRGSPVTMSSRRLSSSRRFEVLPRIVHCSPGVAEVSGGRKLCRSSV